MDFFVDYLLPALIVINGVFCFHFGRRPEVIQAAVEEFCDLWSEPPPKWPTSAYRWAGRILIFFSLFGALLMGAAIVMHAF